MCSGSEAGSDLRRIDLAYHPTLGLRVIKKKKKKKTLEVGLKLIDFAYASTLGLRVIKKKKKTLGVQEVRQTPTREPAAGSSRELGPNLFRVMREV